MRLTISAVAAISGILLLCLAFYGQPAVYIQQAKEQWDAIVDAPAVERPVVPKSDPSVEQVARLEQQITQLQDELAVNKAPAAQPAAPQPTQAPPPAQAVAAAVQPEPPAKPVVAQSARPVTLPQTVLPPVATPQRQELATTEPVMSRPEPAKAEPPRPQVVNPAPPRPPAVVNTAPPKLPEVAKLEPLKPDPAKIDPPKPAPQKVAAVRPVPLPPPMTSRQETDDAQSVLARLRQSPPAPARQVDVAPEVEQPKPRPAPSPSMPRLAAARAALASGRIEDARRQLQEAQLQLVFRPVNYPGEDQPLAAKAAADVAHALEALSANDVPLSRRYIDVATDDLTGAGTSAPVQDVQVRPTGYAPAYPPR